MKKQKLTRKQKHILAARKQIFTWPGIPVEAPLKAKVSQGKWGKGKIASKKITIVPGGKCSPK
jgi:hypothetical protein